MLKGPLTEDQRRGLRWALSLTLIATVILVWVRQRLITLPSLAQEEGLGWLVLFAMIPILWLLVQGPRFIRCNVIGWTYYCFPDHLGQSHIHRQRPDVTKKTDTSGFVAWIPGAIFQVRSGGWFRKNRILHQGDKTWRIDRAWDRLKDVRIRDGLGGEIAGVELDRLLGVVTKFHHMSGLVAHVHETDAIAEHLGRTNAQLIHRIRRERTTMGRSEHARAARETLESAFAEELPGLKDRVDRWTAMAVAEAASSASSG